MTLTKEFTKIKKSWFTLRPARMDDLDAVVAVINQTGIDQIGRPLTNAAEVSGDWKLDSFDLNTSTRVAETADGRIVGYVEVWDTDAIPVQNWVWACVDPRFEGNGIGSSMMDWADKRLLETVKRAPESARVTYRSSALSTHYPSKDLFEDRGMNFVRRFWHMMVDLDGPPPDPAWPAGITISSFAEQPDLRRVAVINDEIFQDHWGFVRQPEDDVVKHFREWIESKPDFDAALWFLAMDGDEIAAICLCSRTRLDYPEAAWVNVLGVRRPWRKQGLGLALLNHAFAVFYREGKNKVGLGVDSSNLTGATRLYEKAGMSVVKQYDAYEKEVRPGRDLSTK